MIEKRKITSSEMNPVTTTLNGNPKTLASSISYLPYGGITGLTYGNTLSLTRGYDNQYRTSSIAVGSTMNRTYNYDANGNVASFVDTDPLASDENAGLYTYQQATNKLTQIQGELNVVYGYDANGNITSANNRTFVYHLSNRLIRVEDNSVTIAEYVYNALNQRVKKIVQGQTTIFHYDLQGHLIAETNPSGATLVEYFYLGDQPLAMIRPGEALYYYHNDHLGTPQILTNDSGTVSWKAVYSPFGEAEISVQTVENPLRFPGQYYDQETGLHYNWNRYYDPKTGRYLTPDPIGLEGGINLWPYVGNSPLNAADPSGLEVRIDPKNGIPYIPQPKPYYPCGPLGCGYGECGITGDGRIVYGRTDLDPGRRVCIDCNPVALFGCLTKLPSPDAAVATGKCLLSIFFFIIGRGEIDCAACSNFGIAVASRITTCLAENCRIGKRDECGRCNYN